MNDRTCPSCGRTVKEVNLLEDDGKCVFCDEPTTNANTRSNPTFVGRD